MCQDGDKPSGIATYGYTLLKNISNAKMLLLNACKAPPAAPPDIHSRIVCIPQEVSHDIITVARAISNQVDANDEEAILFPNAGDTFWAATLKYLHDAKPQVRSQTRVLGMVHSDIKTQYTHAKEYSAIAPTWIGVSHRCAKKLELSAKSLKIEVHELFYPVDEWRGPKLTPTDGLLRLVYAGRLDEPQKRVSRLVDLFKELTRRGIRFRATIAGDGPDGNRFRDLLTEADSTVTGSVKLLGSLDRRDLDRLWAAQDIFLLVSAYEGLPLALLESMSAGVCPVVMNVRSGLPELLEDGVNARVAKQGDLKAMADAIAELDQNRQLLNKLGKAAKRSVSIEAFSPKQHFSKLRKIVRESFDQPLPEKINLDTDSTSVALNKICDKVRGTRSPVVVHGVGMFGRKVIDALMDQGIKIMALFDSEPEQVRGGYRGIVCLSPDKVPEFKQALFVVGSMQFDVEISQRIKAEFKNAGFSCPTIINFRS